jgi:hypothetical protein
MKVKYNAGEFSIGLLKSVLRSYIYKKARKGQVKLKNTQGKVRQLVKTAMFVNRITKTKDND